MYLFGKRKITAVRNRNIGVPTKTEQRITCAGKEKEEKHKQEMVNAHGEDSSENGLTVRILKGGGHGCGRI